MDFHLAGFRPINPNEPQHSYRLKDLLSLASSETLKISRLGIDIFKNAFDLLGFSHAGTFLSHCRQGVIWLGLANSTLNGDLHTPLQSAINSPNDLAKFMGAFRNISQFLAIPSDVILRSDILSEDIDRILTAEHKAYTSELLTIQLLENNLKGADLKLPDLSLVSQQERQKIIAEKINSFFESVIPISRRLGATELFTCLSLISALTKAYILYMEKSNLPPTELLKILKTEAELTIKLQEKIFYRVLQNNASFQHLPQNLQAEIIQEVHDTVMSHLNLILNVENDWIHQELADYKDHLNELCLPFKIDAKGFNEEIDNLMKKSKILTDHRMKMETGAVAAIKNYRDLLKQQLQILEVTFSRFGKALNKQNFENFIKPEFEPLIQQIQEQLVETEKELKEIQESRYEVSSFTLLPLKEQSKLYEDIQNKYGLQQQKKLIESVQFVCRRI